MDGQMSSPLYCYACAIGGLEFGVDLRKIEVWRRPSDVVMSWLRLHSHGMHMTLWYVTVEAPNSVRQHPTSLISCVI
jgi:hypothetical protein